MKRLLMVGAVAALMVAMVVASALPVFADKGGKRGHTKQETSGDCVNLNDCQITTTIAGGGPHGGLSGRSTSTLTIDRPFTQTIDTESQGGGRFVGGGNCSAHFDLLEPENNTPLSGSGNRCN